MIKNHSPLYTVYKVANSSGKVRTIEAPREDLKLIQQDISSQLYSAIEFPESAHGFIPGRSTVSNALPHRGKRWVLNIDLKDFFPSVKAKELELILDSIKAIGPELREKIAGNCYLRGRLPQGAPSSPVLSNIFMLNLDSIFSAFAESYSLSYTRYADDLTFSGGDILKEKRGELFGFVEESVSSHGLSVNHKKTSLTPYYQRQLVTGIVVNNERLTLSRVKKEEIFLACRRKKISDLDGFMLGYLSYIQSIDPTFYNKIRRHMED